MSVFDHWHNRLSWGSLRDRFRAMPMLSVVIPVIVGILLARDLCIPVWVVCSGILISVVGVLYARPDWVSQCFLALLLILLGQFLVITHPNIASTPYDTAVEMRVSIVSPVAARDGYSVADGHIEAWRKGERWHDANDRVQLWLRCDTLGYGDRVHIAGELRERISKYEEYNALMHRRGYVGGVALAEWQILDIEDDKAGGVRRYAIEKLARYAKDAASHSVVEGMVAGSRYNMPAALRASYSKTGLSHILAVSGLHLGIILVVVNLLLSPLKLLHRGHLIADILAVAVLWLFVSMSGASPSVVRAALMFSVLQLIKNSAANYNPMNALAVAVFVMLFCNPQTLYDISFQLSVLAVAGIVAWGGPIVRSLKFKSRIAASVTSTFVIGVVATLWTMPVVSATFDNIPVVGVVATPIVLLTAYVIVGCGVMTLLLPHPLSLPFAYCAEWCASLQNMVVEWFASLPFASVEHTLSPTTIAIYYAVFVVVTLILWSRKAMRAQRAFTLSELEK